MNESEKVIIERDGVEISRSFSRHVVTPDASDITDEVKAAYAAHVAAQSTQHSKDTV